MTFDRAYFSINKKHLLGDGNDVLGLDASLKDFSEILDYEYGKRALADERPLPSVETYPIGTLTSDLFPYQTENITVKSKDMMTQREFDEFKSRLEDNKIRLIQTRFYLSDTGYKRIIDWLSDHPIAYLELSSDLYGFHDQKSFLTSFMGRFEMNKSQGLLIPEDDHEKVYVTTIRTRFHEIDTQNSIGILDELKKGAYFLKES